MAVARISKSSLIFVGLVLVTAVLLVAVVVFDRNAGLEYTLLFHDAKDLRPGAPVKLDGVPIGEVKDVRLSDAAAGGVEVDVRVYPEHKHRVFAPPNSTGYIKKPIVMGDSFVEVINRGSVPGTGMASGSQVEGVETRVGLLAWQTGAVAGEAWAFTVEKSQEQMARLEDWANSPENKARRDQVMGFIESFEAAARDKGMEGAASLREAVARGQDLLEEFRREGQPELAAELDQAVEVLKEAGSEISASAKAGMEAGMEGGAAETPVPAAEPVSPPAPGEATAP